MTNHYQILGLNSDGNDEKGQPYTEAAIKSAYKKASIAAHPDKEPDKSEAAQKVATDKFAAVKKAYDVLSDPNQRAVFDKKLKENPDAFGEKQEEALILSVPEQSQDEKQTSTSREVVARQQVDLTILMASVGYDGAQIVAIAEHNLPFAKAVLNNVQASNFLSLSQRFELMLFLIAEGVRVGRSMEETVDTDPAIQQLLKMLSSEKEAEQAFRPACTLHPALATIFFSAKPEIVEKFSVDTLFALGLEFYEVAQCALKKKDLLPAQVFWFMSKHP